MDVDLAWQNYPTFNCQQGFFNYLSGVDCSWMVGIVQNVISLCWDKLFCMDGEERN